MNETIKNIAIVSAMGLSALSISTGSKDVVFDPTYFPIVEDKVTFDTSSFDSRYISKNDVIEVSQIKDLPHTISYSNALLENLIDGTDKAIARLNEKQVQANLNQSSTTAPDYVKGKSRISDLEAQVTELERQLKEIKTP